MTAAAVGLSPMLRAEQPQPSAAPPLFAGPRLPPAPRNEGAPAPATAVGQVEDPATAQPPAASLPAPRLGRGVAEPIRPAPAVVSSTPAPWWLDTIVRPMRRGSTTLPITVDDLIIQALRHAPQIRAISDEALILATAVGEAQAAFDVHSFMESKFVRTSEPVGNALITGGPDRFRDSDWTYVAGIRKNTWLGGSVELSQRLGYQDNNSNFFIPTQQGNARLSLNYRQPLLNGAGKAYNMSLTMLAEIDTDIAWSQTYAQLQDQVFQITSSYWQLLLDRAVLVQKQRHLERAESVYDELEARRDVDALVSQVVRARSAVEIRRAELIRAETAVRNTETRIRTLVNAPPWQDADDIELIPTEPPALGLAEVSAPEAVRISLQNRPEVDRAVKEIEAAQVRLDMSYNELRPALTLVLESYVAGLDGSSDVGGSFVNQFNQGEPSYTAGLLYERPFYNRAARLRNQRRKLEMRQLTSRFAATINELKQQVVIAVREVNTSYREMQGAHTAMQAATSEVEFLHERWRLLPGDDRSASFVLVDLLDAQDRLVREEFRLALAQREYTMSLTELQRATGTLLQFEQISTHSECEGGLPRTVFEKPASTAKAFNQK